MTLIIWIVGIYLVGYIFAYIGIRALCFFFEEGDWTLEDRFLALQFSFISWLWLPILLIGLLIYFCELIKKKIKAYIKTLDMKKKVIW